MRRAYDRLCGHGPRSSFGSSRALLLPFGIPMSDRSHGANGSVTSGSFLLVARSCERRTSSTREGVVARSSCVRCYGEPARGPDGALRPTALRAERVYAVTRGQTAIAENIRTNLTSFPPSTNSTTLFDRGSGVWHRALLASRDASEKMFAYRRSGPRGPLLSALMRDVYARIGCRVRRTLTAANASTSAVARVAAAPTKAAPQLKPSLAVASTGAVEFTVTLLWPSP